MEETLSVGAPCVYADQTNGGGPLLLWISSILAHRFFEGGCLAILYHICKIANPVREKEVTVLGLM